MIQAKFTHIRWLANYPGLENDLYSILFRELESMKLDDQRRGETSIHYILTKPSSQISQFQIETQRN